ncbi:hypothetical protein Vadar_003915 [Vaccinium darrowii]|uniref:Uncharacterized protein n=1 Tax=Vaccinium darrowii TaxID=229202 RepID=A0ACB7YL20_9ERIC|nr:hypothetical protein Vadar_003915 [Vaccinium darrowii]
MRGREKKISLDSGATEEEAEDLSANDEKTGDEIPSMDLEKPIEKCGGFTSYVTCDEDYNCEYFVRYRDRSTSRNNIAEEIIMVVNRRSKPRIPLLFGCGFDDNDTTGENFPSVVGLKNSQRSLIGQLEYAAFSYCHDMKNNASVEVGRESARLWGSSTPLVPNYEGFYQVRHVDIMVNKEGLNMP